MQKIYKISKFGWQVSNEIKSMKPKFVKSGLNPANLMCVNSPECVNFVRDSYDSAQKLIALQFYKVF